MNVGIIGYGKMGKMIHEVASSRGHNIGVILKEPNWQSQEVAGLDVVIEFTNPKSAVENIKKCFLEKACHVNAINLHLMLPIWLVLFGTFIKLICRNPLIILSR